MRGSDAPGGDLLILGLGNVLCADDGLGVAAVERLLDEYELPKGVSALDGGTLGLSLLGYAAGAETLVLVDAIRTDDPPGTLVRMAGQDVAPAVRERLSVHQIGVADLLDGMQLIDRCPPRLLLIGLVPESLELRAALSPVVEGSLDGLVRAVAELSAELGHPLERKKQPQNHRTRLDEQGGLPRAMARPSAEPPARNVDRRLDHVPVERLH